MDKFMISHITRKQFRVIVRGGLFRFSLFFTCFVVFGLQLFFQGDYFEHSLTGLSTMASLRDYFCFFVVFSCRRFFGRRTQVGFDSGDLFSGGE